MDRKHIESNNIIERYLLGKLDDQETLDFEDAFAFDPELQKEIDTAEQLISVLEKSNQTNESVSAQKTIRSTTDSSNPASNVISIQPEEKAPKTRSWLPVSIAANVLLTIGASYWLLNLSPPAISSEDTISFVNAPRLTLEYTRGSEAVMEAIPYTRDWLFLSISAAGSGGKPERIRIIDSGNKPILEENGFNYDPLEPWIEWGVRGELLKPGSYLVEVVPNRTNINQTVLKLPFKICDPSSSRKQGC